MPKTILQAEKSYSFSDYFKLSNPTKDIVAEFGYTYVLKKLALPRSTQAGPLQELKTTFYKKLPHISLTSEIAKREILVAPILLKVMDYIDFSLDIEYPLYINERLQGTIDYVLRSSTNLIVIEAKNADMERGFSQLAVELIAMEHYLDDGDNGHQTLLYGAVTVGDLWRFGTLERTPRQICKDIDSFRIPLDVDELFAILLGILSPAQVL